MESKNNKSEEIDNLRYTAPNLSKIGSQNPFDVPEGYFDELPHIIQQRCLEQKEKTPLWEKFAFLFKPIFALPVVMAIVLFTGSIYFITNSKNNISAYRITDSLSLTENIQHIDEMLIIESFEKTIEETNDDTPIIDYLIDNDIETTTITNEL